MEARQIPLVLALAVCVAMLVAVPVVGMGTGGGQSAQVDNNTTSETNGSFGQQVSAFMQTSAVDANTTVESGMWNAAVNTSESPEKEVTTRANRLERELQRLERKVAQLQEKRENGMLPEVAYTAQASSLRERIVNLREQINETEQTARRVGVNTSSLDRLRTQAANLTGPEVSAIARNITAAPRGPPAGTPGGPPDVASPAGNESGPPKNAGPSGNESGPSGPPEAGNQTGSPSDDGPNDGATPGGDSPPGASDSGNESRTPTDAGPSNQTAGQNDSDTSPPEPPVGDQTNGDRVGQNKTSEQTTSTVAVRPVPT